MNLKHRAAQNRFSYFETKNLYLDFIYVDGSKSTWAARPSRAYVWETLVLLRVTNDAQEKGGQDNDLNKFYIVKWLWRLRLITWNDKRYSRTSNICPWCCATCSTVILTLSAKQLTFQSRQKCEKCLILKPQYIYKPNYGIWFYRFHHKGLTHRETTHRTEAGS